MKECDLQKIGPKKLMRKLQKLTYIGKILRKSQEDYYEVL